MARKVAEPPEVAGTLRVTTESLIIMPAPPSANLCAQAPALISADVCYELPRSITTPAVPLLSPAAVDELAATFAEIPPVSDDLLVPIEVASTLGRNYVVRQRAVQYERRAAEQQLFGTSRPKRPILKAYVEVKSRDVTRRVEMDIWDAILPMLQPPFDLNMPETLDLPHQLYDYQKPGIEFLADSRSALLGDEMGTGKTVMALVALRLLFRRGQVKSALIVCPRSILGVWERHIEKWAPELRGTTTRVHGARAQRMTDWKMPAHIYLTTYGTVRNDVISAAERGGDDFEN